MVDQNEEGTHTNVTCPVRFRLLKNTELNQFDNFLIYSRYFKSFLALTIIRLEIQTLQLRNIQGNNQAVIRLLQPQASNEKKTRHRPLSTTSGFP